MNKADPSDISKLFLLFLFLPAGCFTLWHFNPRLFYGVSALFGIFVSFAAFILSYVSRNLIANNYIKFIGISFLISGLVELLHFFAPAMNGMTGSHAAVLSLKFMILGNIIRSLSFVTAPIFTGRSFSYGNLFASLLLISVFLAGIICSGIIPYTHVNYEATSFFSMFCGLLYFLSLVLLIWRRNAFSNRVFQFFFLSIVLFLLSELFQYPDQGFHSYGFFLGRLSSILAFLFIYEAAVNACLIYPLDSLRQELKNEKEISHNNGNVISAILNDTSILVVVMDRHGRILRVNRAWEILTGYSSSEVETAFIWDFFLIPEDSESSRRFFDNAGVMDFPLASESRWKAKDGSWKIISWSFCAAIDNVGSISAIIGLGADMTMRVDKERGLQFQADALEHAGDSVLIHDISGKVLYANQAFFEFTGYERKDILAHPFEKIISEQNIQRSRHRLERLKYTGKAKFESSFFKKDGTVLPVEVNARIVEIQGECLFVSVVRDISVRKLYQRSLKDRYIELSSLYRISAAVSNALTFDELFPKILDSIVNIGMLDVERKGAIFVVENDRLKLVSFVGDLESFSPLHDDMKIGDCLCGHAARHGEILITKDTRQDGEHPFKQAEKNARAHMAIPLNSKNRLVGVMSLYLEHTAGIDEPKINLLRAIGNQVAIALENAKLYEEMKSLALHDPLTGFANRRLMEVVFERSMAEAKRFRQPFSVIMADIDFFKKYNDTYGHAAGDELLVRFSRVVSEQTREIDFLSRYGGEEFLIILPETDLNETCIVAERIRKHMEENVGVTVSFGIAAFTQTIKDKEELIVKADNALYRAKQNGRNRIEAAL